MISYLLTRPWGKIKIKEVPTWRFPSVDALAREMHAIATDDVVWWRYHAWRYQHPAGLL